MVIADVVNAAVIGSVPVAAWVGVLTVPHVLVAAFAAQAARVGTRPALVVMAGLTVPAVVLAWASPLRPGAVTVADIGAGQPPAGR